MNRPAIDSPASRSSSAATEESTPPDMPTITRAFMAPVAAATADGAGRRGNRRPPATRAGCEGGRFRRSEEPTSELQSLMRISYDVFCMKKKKTDKKE